MSVNQKKKLKIDFSDSGNYIMIITMSIFVSTFSRIQICLLELI